jgi:hypothetical protein
MLQCAQKLLDTADIVREAIFRQQPHSFHVAGQTGLSSASWPERAVKLRRLLLG